MEHVRTGLSSSVKPLYLFILLLILIPPRINVHPLVAPCSSIYYVFLTPSLCGYLSTPWQPKAMRLLRSQIPVLCTTLTIAARHHRTSMLCATRSRLVFDGLACGLINGFGIPLYWWDLIRSSIIRGGLNTHTTRFAPQITSVNTSMRHDTRHVLVASPNALFIRISI